MENILLFLLVYGGLAYWLRAVWKSAGLRDKKIFALALPLKIFMGLLYGLVYFNHYGFGDTIVLSQDAETILKHTKDVSWFNYFRFLFFADLYDRPALLPALLDPSPRALFMSKWISFAFLAGFRNYWAASVFFSSLSFLGLWAWYISFSKQIPRHKHILALSLFAVPSVAFWASGVSKESLMVFFIGHLWYFYLFILRGRLFKTEALLTIPFLLLGLLKSKYYYFAAFAVSAGAGGAAWWLSRKTGGRRSLALFCAFLSVFALAGTFFHPNLKLDKLASALVNNHRRIVQNSAEGFYARFENLEADGLSILKNVPEALVTGLARPSLFDIGTGNAALFAVALENTALLLGLMFALARLRRSHLQLFARQALWPAILLFVLALAVFLPLAAPNFGTLTRYKTGYLPFLWLAAFWGLGYAWEKIRPRLKENRFF